MKTIKSLKRVLVLAVIAGATTFVSCKKEEIDAATPAVGNYIGSGEDAAGTPFVNKVVTITKISNTRIKVEPSGHTSITAFEVEVMKMPTGPTSTDEETTDFAVRTDTSPNTIAFDCNGAQNFGGTRQ